MGFYEVKNKTTKTGVKIRAAKSKVARKVPVAYTVKNGITRLVWEEGEGEIVAGTVIYLELGRQGAAAGNVGDRLLIAGGQTPSGQTNTVETFSKSLQRSSAFRLSSNASYIKSAKTSNHLLFIYRNSNTHYLDSYDSSFTVKNLTHTFSNLDSAQTGSLQGKAFIFDVSVKELSIIDDSLTVLSKVSSSILSNENTLSMDNHILFAGAYNKLDVAAVDSAGTEIALADMDILRFNMDGGYTGKHALYVGGDTIANVYYNEPLVYDNALTKVSAAPIPTARMNIKSTRLGSRALFAGGYSYTNEKSAYYDEAFCYDGSLALEVLPKLYRPSRYAAAGTIGNHALFAGGITLTVTAGDSSINVYTLQ